MVVGCGRINFGAGDASTDGDIPPNARCGDLICTAAIGETCHSCADCNTRAFVCGNLMCDPGETGNNCPADCGPTAWPAAWTTVENDFLFIYNTARAGGQDCPAMMNMQMGTLTVVSDLTEVARVLTWSFALEDGAPSCNGTTASQMASDRSLSFASAWGAFGRPTVTGQAVFDSLMMSSTSCPYMMDPAVTQIGVAFVETATLGTLFFYVR
jgi:hypothetical protein